MKKIINPKTKTEYLINKYTLLRKRKKNWKISYDILIKSKMITERNWFYIKDIDWKIILVNNLEKLDNKLLLNIIKIVENNN